MWEIWPAENGLASQKGLLFCGLPGGGGFKPLPPPTEIPKAL